MTAQRNPHLFTSESVTEGHPDKLADQISDAILDTILAQDPKARVACETALTTGTAIVMGEISTSCYVDIPQVVRETIRDVGYVRAKYGFDFETCGVMVCIEGQSPDIARGVDQGGAGDQGMMFGFACDETEELMPAPIQLAHAVSRRLAEARKDGSLPWARPDGKSQVTVEYDGQGRPVHIATVVVSAQHSEDIEPEQVAADVRAKVIAPALPADLFDATTQVLVNPTGRFVIGGPKGDTGLTGRKIMVDSYGGVGRHGGGSFSGKDPTKVDRSGAYGARYVAKNLVAAGIARRVEVQLAYAIGVVQPVSVSIDSFGSGAISDVEIAALVRRHFDLSPGGLIRDLDLRRPIYRPLAAYGHFGRGDLDLPWERLSLADDLARELGLDRPREAAS